MDSSTSIQTLTNLAMDLERTIYSVSNGDLKSLDNYGRSKKKEFFFSFLGVCITSFLNALPQLFITPHNAQIKDSTSLLINTLVFFVSLALCIVFGIQMNQEEISYAELISDIKERPKFKVSLDESEDAGKTIRLSSTKEENSE